MSALQAELRKKYKTPQEAARALGIDPKLVEDAALATDPPVSEKQRKAMWAAAKGHSTLGIPQKVGKEFVGEDESMKRADDKKAHDKFPKAAMDWLKGHMDAKSYDEFCAKDEWPDEAEDEKEDDEDKAKDSKRADDKRADDKAKDIASVRVGDKKKAMDKKAKDSEEEEAEEVNEGKKDVKQSEDKKAKDSKRAMDKKAKDSDEDDDKAMDRQAMDEAIAAQVDKAAAALEKSIEAKYRDRYAAAEMVRPYIGEVSPMAFDSGDAIKVHALEKLGVKDVADLSGKALDKILGYQQKAGARPVERSHAPLAMDEGTKSAALKIAPGLAKQSIGV